MDSASPPPPYDPTALWHSQCGKVALPCGASDAPCPLVRPHAHVDRTHARTRPTHTTRHRRARPRTCTVTCRGGRRGPRFRPTPAALPAVTSMANGKRRVVSTTPHPTPSLATWGRRFSHRTSRAQPGLPAAWSTPRGSSRCVSPILSDPLLSRPPAVCAPPRPPTPLSALVFFFLIVFLCCTSLRFQANHAGGYYFRLCPASEELTEECFQRTPVPFATNTTVIRSQSGSTTVPAVMLSKGTIPAGSTWKMNPVPECCPGASDTAPGACEARGYTCGSYQTTGSGPKCGSHQCGDDSGMGKSVPAFPWPTKDPSAPPTGVAPKFAIVDQLRIPASIKPGHYVLGWRWDCEARQLRHRHHFDL